MNGKGNWRYRADNSELLALIRPELERLTAQDSRGRAPSRVIWDVRRDKGLPCANYILKRMRCGWPALVDACGITPSRTYRRADGTVVPGGIVQPGLADEIERGLAAGRIQPATWMDRFRNELIFTTEEPVRVEHVPGRTVTGQHVIIQREYWMVR